MKNAVLVLVCLLGVRMQAMGTVVFVNANSSNTVGWNDSTDWWTNASYTGDDKWRYRTGFGMGDGDSLPALPTGMVDGDEIYQSIDSGQSGKDARTLKTTISGLDAGKEYTIYTYFWSDQSGSPWSIRAALTQAGLASAVFSPYSGSPTQVATDSASRKLWQADLGAVTGVTSVDVWIDDLPTNSSNERTWYDGVGYEVVPEPATLILLGLGALAAIRNRK
jgi:hypothetical protein